MGSRTATRLPFNEKTTLRNKLVGAESSEEVEKCLMYGQADGNTQLATLGHISEVLQVPYLGGTAVAAPALSLAWD